MSLSSSLLSFYTLRSMLRARRDDIQNSACFAPPIKGVRVCQYSELKLLGVQRKRVNIITITRLLVLGEKSKKRPFFPLEGQKTLYMDVKRLELDQIVCNMGLL